MPWCNASYREASNPPTPFPQQFWGGSPNTSSACHKVCLFQQKVSSSDSTWAWTISLENCHGACPHGQSPKPSMSPKSKALVGDARPARSWGGCAHSPGAAQSSGRRRRRRKAPGRAPRGHSGGIAESRVPARPGRDGAERGRGGEGERQRGEAAPGTRRAHAHAPARGPAG